MACSIPSPSWDSLTEQGLISASENIADGYINLDIASVEAVNNFNNSPFPVSPSITSI